MYSRAPMLPSGSRTASRYTLSSAPSKTCSVETQCSVRSFTASSLQDSQRLDGVQAPPHEGLGQEAEEQQRERVHREQRAHLARAFHGDAVPGFIKIHELHDAQVVEG